MTSYRCIGALLQKKKGLAMCLGERHRLQGHYLLINQQRSGSSIRALLEIVKGHSASGDDERSTNSSNRQRKIPAEIKAPLRDICISALQI